MLRLSVLFLTAALFYRFYVIGLDDGHDFLPARGFYGHVDNGEAALFDVTGEGNTTTVTRSGGGDMNLQDMYRAIARHRAGPDGEYNSADDRFSLREMMGVIRNSLKSNYPHRTFADDCTWHFNYEGGLVGEMCYIYVDVNEYLVFFGSPVPLQGYGGVYPFDAWDFLLSGTMTSYQLGDLHQAVFRPLPDTAAGETDTSVYWDDTQMAYALRDGAFLFEYGRGNIQRSFFKAVVHATVFQSMDLRSLWITLKESMLLNYYNFHWCPVEH